MCSEVGGKGWRRPEKEINLFRNPTPLSQQERACAGVCVREARGKGEFSCRSFYL